MAGWSHEKRERVEIAFYQYLDRCFVNSKDAGEISLGKHLYWGQMELITEIFDALEEDIHQIYVLKSRQLGISTLIRALCIFLLGVHKALKGAIVFDTDQNKSESRVELELMIDGLPANLKFPSIKNNNRAGLTLENNSKVLFMSAGVRKTKSSGTLGRSVGLTIAHCSELCSWDNEEGFEAFQQSLSEVHPDRLYIYESTARGFNFWNDLWINARNDPDHCKCVFLGFWSKQSQRIDRDDKDFEKYGLQPPTDKELKKIQAVREQYSFEVSQEILAWYRRKMDPSAKSAEGETIEFEGSTTKIQEQPWTEEEAFQQTGSVFFTPETLTDHTNKYVNKNYERYMFTPGQEFMDMLVHKAPNQKMTELKVWEEPEPNDACYTIGVDPAYGENEHNDRSAIEVFRCYADGVDQVAEYASPLITAQQLAWVLATIMGWYGQGNNEVRYILEINGPGSAVFTELKSLQYKIDNATWLQPMVEEKGLRNLFQNIKTYIYTRVDAMGAGYNWHWLTNTRLKIMVLERLRDHISRAVVRIRSADLINEMQSIARDGDTIGAQGSKKDDRVLAAALAAYNWEQKSQKNLISQRRTREAEEARKIGSVVDRVALFNRNHLDMFFKAKQGARRQDQAVLARNAWRYR
jgi:hypothetical protein